ncbi:MFS transporter [Pseudomonas sp. RIT-PI-AD]|uniref:MFS transporter n=1 Tax=Pseudomonas sp. RIT-PI-AD TaxID=3035294 RepID=UPI0021D8B7BF|nr:MFS transporter [Pseudomonas sp. RIT-PI-AD]
MSAQAEGLYLNEPVQAASALGVAASCFGFVVMGALQALYGPAIPHLLERFGIGTAEAGMSLSAHFIGALVGVLLFHKVYGSLSNRLSLGLSYGLMALGCLLFAYAQTWPLALAGAFVIGLGFGGGDFGLNFIFSIGFGKRSVAMVNLLNAHFGIGAIAGPALVGWFGAEHYQAIFLGFALCSILPALFLGQMARSLGDPPPTRTGHAATRHGALAIMAAFFVIYIFHVAIETGVGGWEPTHLEALGYGAAFAATATSLYWLALTGGRFFAAWLGLRWSSERMMRVSCIGMTLCLVAALVPQLAAIAYIGVGLFIAPIFPTGLAWLNRVVPAARASTAYVIAASMVGGIAFPPLIGKLIETQGVSSAPLFMALLSLLCTGATFAIIRGTRAALGPSTGTP